MSDKVSKTLPPKPGRSFADVCPDIAQEAHGWDPRLVSAKSNTKQKWKCPAAHIYEADPAHRADGRGCPYCSNKKLLVGYNDLATTHPSIAQEAHGWDPTSLVAGSNKKMNWQCQFGHVWETQVNNRTGSRTGCPYCSSRRVMPGFNDLATTRPDLAAELVTGDGTDVTKSAHQRRLWKCELGHQWEATVADRNAGSGCPYCAGQKIMIGFNDLATVRPDIAAQADGWDPTTVTEFNDNKKPWICELGHQWVTSTASRSSGTGCPVCSNKSIQIGYNDLATTHPEIAIQAHGWNPSTSTAGTNTKREFICLLGHVVKQNIVTRVNSKGLCPVCSNKAVLTGYNDMATTHPELSAEADGWDPRTVVAGTNKNLPWVCNLGHRWVATGGNRSSFDQRCPVCVGRKVQSGFNDLATTHPEISVEAHGWDPTTVSRGSHAKKEWRCAEGHVWPATIKDRVAGYGCPSCASSGYNQLADGFLYLIEHDALQMQQVGISNFPEQRLAQHAKRGWVPLDLRGPMDGLLTKQLEQHIIAMLKRRGVQFADGVDVEKFDGWTEAWMRDDLNVAKLRELIEMLHNEEALQRPV